MPKTLISNRVGVLKNKIDMKFTKYLLCICLAGMLVSMTMSANAVPQNEDPEGIVGTYGWVSTPVGTIHICNGPPLDCIFVPYVE
jgi:hypothetical protein